MGNKAVTGPELLASGEKHATSEPPAERGKKRRIPLSWLVGFGAVAVTGSAAIGYKLADYQCAQKEPAASSAGWRGTLAKLVRGGADAAGGLTATSMSGAAVALAAGGEVYAGMTLVTDARTRARFEFEDGTSLILDRGTAVTLGETARTMRVMEGAILADVATTESGAGCVMQSPTGELRTAGAKFALTATEERTSVEVLRGDVDVQDLSQGKARVGAGQEAALFKTARLEVVPANDLGQRVAFGESFGAAHNEDTDAPASGLGELRARRPGSSDEKDHAVRLARHDVKVRIVGNVAKTEIDESFFNDTDQELEGVYRFPLPPGAQIERLALEVDGKLVDGSFVDKQKGAAIWRGVIQNAAPSAPKPQLELIWVPGPWRDPALLEWQRGGRSELKIFPIPKKGARRIVIAYTETIAPVAGVRRYVYPLPQATASDIKIDTVNVDVQVLGADKTVPVRARGYELSHTTSFGGAEKLEKTMTGFTPTGDLVVEYALADRGSDVTGWAFTDRRANATGLAVDARGTARTIVKTEDPYVALALRPKLPQWADAKPRDQVVVIDAGRAMFGERFQRAKRLAVQLTQEMDRRDRITVMACDVTCSTLPGGFKAPGSGTAREVDGFLSSIAPDGASDLVGAVRAAAHVADHDAKRDFRVVVLSDGVASAGYRSAARVATEVKEALPDARAMVVTVPIGTDADIDTLKEIAQGGGGVLVPYQPGEKLETAALDVLTATYGITLRDVELTLPEGLYEQAPGRVGPMRAGSETIIAARMKGDHVKGDAVLRGTVGGEPFEARYPLDLTSSDGDGNAFVPRIYAALRIADRERDGGDAAKAELVALSQRYAVPSKHTSLLVLESEAMFSAFGIDRTARAASWTGESAAQSTEVATVSKAGEPSADGAMDDLAKDKREASGERAAPGYHGAPDEGRGFAQPPPAPSATAASPTTTSPPPSTAGADAAQRRISGGWGGPSRPRNPRGEWMKRVWFRTGAIAVDERPLVDSAKIAAARTSLQAAPDERRRHLELVRLLSRNGAVGDLEEELTKWAARDPLDADAIGARADLLARTGHRDDALRVLGGVAHAATDATLASIALAHERAGRVAEACAFRIASAELRPSDVDAVAAAVACERTSGHAVAATRWLSAQKTDAVRAAIESAAAKLRSTADSVGFGDVTVDATWEGGADLDLAIVDPAGNRLSWVGRSKGVRAADCASTTHEALAISSQQHGAFAIEIVRSSSERQTGPVSGKLKITSIGGQVRQVPFVLTGSRAQVARVDVRWDSQLVAAEPQDIPQPLQVPTQRWRGRE